MNIDEKMQNLYKYIGNLESVAVAFSGGVDSTFLLKAAHEVLGSKAIAVTARSLSFPERELNEAKEFTANNNIKHIIVDSEELDIDGFSNNPKNRCYLCKTELFTKINAIARQNGIANVIEGSNCDDTGDYRPGLIAVREQGILSPLIEAALTKSEIRLLSKKIGLKTWDKQSFACLSSRFPYGEKITPEKLIMIDKAEQFLLDMGFHQVRVRCHTNSARIEIDEADFSKMIDSAMRLKVHAKLRELGFIYVSLDLKGYRTGSMNETLIY